MTTQILAVDDTNWRACANLEIAEEEKSFVDPNAFTIAEWKFEPENTVKAIYSDSVLVGMLAYYFHDGVYGEFYWLYHLMIDTQHQGKGYGQAAVKLALCEMRKLGAKDIVTSHIQKNTRAHCFYTKLGFEENGTLDGGDIFLRLPSAST